MPTVNRLPPEVLRNRYIRAHQMLQAAIGEKARLEMRVQILEAENRALHAQLDEKSNAGRR